MKHWREDILEVYFNRVSNFKIQKTLWSKSCCTLCSWLNRYKICYIKTDYYLRLQYHHWFLLNKIFRWQNRISLKYKCKLGKMVNTVYKNQKLRLRVKQVMAKKLTSIKSVYPQNTATQNRVQIGMIISQK